MAARPHRIPSRSRAGTRQRVAGPVLRDTLRGTLPTTCLTFAPRALVRGGDWSRDITAGVCLEPHTA